MTGRYAQPAALRRALEDRLKKYSRDRGLPLDRVRKEAAFQRLLARIAAVAPSDSWALKGGQAMIARSSGLARATADADATWRTDANQLQAVLTTAVGLDLGDHFQFLLAPPTSMRGEGPEGVVRFPVQARLAGRLFEPLHLDLNLVPGDTRPIEKLALHNLFDFAGLPAVIVPAVGPAQQLAEKLHAYTRDYGKHENSRVKDLYDMLLIAADLTLPPLRDLTGACTETFALRSTAWPPRLDHHLTHGPAPGPGSSTSTASASPAWKRRTTRSPRSGNPSSTTPPPATAPGTVAPGPGSVGINRDESPAWVPDRVVTKPTTERVRRRLGSSIALRSPHHRVNILNSRLLE